VIRRIVRVAVAPALLLAAAVATFAPAFATGDLVRAGAVSAMLGAAGAMVLRWEVPVVAGPVVVMAAIAAAAALAPPRPVGPGAIGTAVSTFLSVGLPADGLDDLLVVVALVITPTAVLTMAASLRRRPVLTLAGPVAATVVGTVLVAPTAPPAWPALAIAAVGCAVLGADARSDISAMPPLVGSRTEERHQRSWWRPAAQLGATLAAVGLTAALPLPRATDLRDVVEPRTVRVEDPNPLSVAAHWLQLEEPATVAEIDLDGPAPGRLRLSVLDRYTSTGWHQAADFLVTGRALAADPLGVDPPPNEQLDGSGTWVTVTPTKHLRPFRAVPTAGRPISVRDPEDLRYAAGPGIVLAERSRAVSYRALPTPRPAPDPTTALVPTVVPDVPAELLRCPDSDAVRAVATQLTSGIGPFEERLDALEDWLLTRRIYDPSAPGGQTLAAVDTFVRTSYARGNLEVFVTTYALLARCAGVPVRVVVGVPELPEGSTEVAQDALAAWVEVPVDGQGWVARDPLPTPEEQEALAQMAQEPPSQPEEPEPDQPEPAQVEALDPPSDDGVTSALALGVVLVAAVLAAGAWMPRWVHRRRRHLADPTAAVLAAWTTVLDELSDRRIPVSVAHTPQEVAAALASHVPIPVRRAVELLAPIVDGARYRGTPATDEEASTAWALADLARVRLPHRRRDHLRAVIHPLRTLRRVRAVVGTERRATAWEAALPPEVAAAGDEAPADVPGVTLDRRIGAGATGTVFRGTLLESGADVAVKVFRFGPGDDGFDERRFRWEIHVAREVSGYPHLPEVLGAGTTPSEARPYLITTLYEDGTLLDRVRRGGPLTVAEAIAVGVDLATALATLHQLGVVHGDVKPENAFAGREGWVLGDLGSAWLRARRGPARSLTPPYAAPEVWRGSSPTPAADLYSLGLTVLFAATGEVPVAGNAPDLAQVRALFGDHHDLARLVDPDPRRRPRSAAELARRLRPGRPSAAFVDGGLSLPTPTVTTARP
jgi:transglutaminase-like putative cysteine protease